MFCRLPEWLTVFVHSRLFHFPNSVFRWDLLTWPCLQWQPLLPNVWLYPGNTLRHYPGNSFSVSSVLDFLVSVVSFAFSFLRIFKLFDMWSYNEKRRDRVEKVGHYILSTGSFLKWPQQSELAQAEAGSLAPPPCLPCLPHGCRGSSTFLGTFSGN